MSILAYDIETIAPDPGDGSFPPWPTHVPIAIGFAGAVDHGGGDWRFDLDAFITAPSPERMLVEADRRMARAQTVVTYNGRQFDALVLRLAAQKAKIFCLPALAAHAAAPRFGAEHADLADLYASYGRKVSLSGICKAVDIPVKTSVSGADVGALWEAGEHEQVRAYVLEDAVATLSLWFVWAAARAADEALVTRPLAALARHIESDPSLASLMHFVDSELTVWARPRAMLAEIGAALRDVERTLRKEEDERQFAASSP